MKEMAFVLLVAAGAARAQLPSPDTRAAKNECSSPKPGWIWCDDFEVDRLATAFEYGPKAQFVRTAGAGRDGSWGMSATYTPAQSEAGFLRVAFGKVPSKYFRPVDDGTKVYRDVYWRWYVMHPVTWTGGGPDKMTRAVSFASPSWATAMVAHVWDGTPPSDSRLHLEAVSGTDPSGTLKTERYNDFPRFRWIGPAIGSTDFLDAAHIGKWMCVEAHALLNDAGLSNGIFELWVDGRPEARRDGLNWLGGFSAYGINAVMFENYWNAKSPTVQSRYWDNLVISTQRIGC